ncbi:uncharacterized protein EKO05_0011272 [Ascochyta rabiei]|uniref:Uncharacterized protein n=1 Tax=Didymella rabiei TaxID=5454 RepID=A0A163E7Y9_DIDRA|nr:uncharacterized protein EKO05_0011272 [Ascochyta rabiei]KZM23567.1 hypothetical protein ST47_g5293 [Ascochyta rabiei]UPX21067.1 hypothetical protein EKO05_0011272 [Ascochyta rabiei]
MNGPEVSSDMAAAKSHLEFLPEELILTIVDHLDCENFQSLRALSQASQRLHRLTLEHLYHGFPGRNSELFLRTIAKSPKLASHVKQAIWHQERRTRLHIDNIEKTHIVRKLNQLVVPQQGTDLAEQFAKFGKNDDYWYMEVLLLFMPNLESLTIRDSWLWDDHHYWFKSLSPFFNPLCNSKLTTATLYGPLRIENTVPLLTIPSLRTLELTQVIVMRREGYRVFQWSLWPVARLLPDRDPIAETGSNLETLALRESDIDLAHLLPILRGIKALKSFTYEHHPNDLAVQTDTAVHGEHANKDAVSRICEMHCASLTHLRIRDTQVWDAADCSTLFTPSQSDDKTHSHSALQTLDIGPFTPPGVSDTETNTESAADPTLTTSSARFLHALPATLKTLTLQISYTHTPTPFLRALAQNLPHTHTGLRDIVLSDWRPTLGWYPDALAALQQEFQAVGVRLGSVAGDVRGFYEAEPLLVDEEAEAGWVVVTDLGFGWGAG